MHLWNTSAHRLIGHYGGIPYVFEPGERKTIKNAKVIDRKTGLAAEHHMAEDIARQLYADLQVRGVVLIDEEHPLSDEQYLAMGKEAQVAFINALIEDFNALNSEIASGGGKKILTVPKHYRALQRERLKLMTEIGQEPGEGDPDFVSPEELKALQERAEVPRQEALNKILQAVARGDMDGLMAAAKTLAASDAGTVDSAFVGDTPEGEIADVAPARAVNIPGRRRGRKGNRGA
ncbi:MAG TPA: hypothetical protein VJV75_13365 [Candidatus Polarisedimenticolia bacterium]|nr:hypothetical protein [Candidatus Polarisedimenticolia bacterium]